MKHTFTEKKRLRRSFTKTLYRAEIPSLLQLQRASYHEFLQQDTPPEKRRNFGLQQAFKTIFPIKSSSGMVQLEFDSYELVEQAYGEQECKDRGLTYMMSVYANIRMETKDKKGSLPIVKSERVYMGDLPMMTDYGSFIVNGTERVVVSQLHRSPGVFFDHDSGRGSLSKKYLYSARIIPYSGRWLDFEFDQRDLVYFRIDRRRKMPVTIILKAIGYTEEQILREFYEFDHFLLGMKEDDVKYRLNSSFLQNSSFPFDLKKGNKILVAKNQRIKKADIAKIEELEKDYPVDDSFLEGKRLAKTLCDSEGEVVADANAELTRELINDIRTAGIHEIETLHFNELNRGPYISHTMALDGKVDQEAARSLIYRMLRPGDPPSKDVVNNYFDHIFYNSDNYDLSKVGRMKLNRRLDRSRDSMEYRIWVKKEGLTNREVIEGAAKNLVQAELHDSFESAKEFLSYIQTYNSLSVKENLTKEAADALSAQLNAVPHEVLEQTTLSQQDLMQVVTMLVDLRNGKGKTDDIDSLTNRRVRMVGEFVANQFQQGLARVDRAIRDRLSRAESEGLMPHELISAKAVSGSVAEFFNGNQLSQFMDQTNPLSEITHKRRVSALGVGGLSRDRVGFEVRDVHPTHYGRVCPIETPEGQNIGLINSMALYSNVDSYGFLQTRYLRVENGKVIGAPVWLSAIEEEGKVIVQANSRRKTDGTLLDDMLTARKDGEYIIVPPSDVDYMDVSPAQISSVAAGLVPFLEHDDANRALMGSNMQRQAVPCMRPEKPLVGTGVERSIASDSGTVVRVRRNGTVRYVDADVVVVSVDADQVSETDSLGVDIYDLVKHVRSNQNTDINQRPLVQQGDTVRTGDIIADGAGTDIGELALGQNLLVAFLPWNGYNFEDSILISERVVAEQRFTSVHIIEQIANARSTQLGDEEITLDIPHQSESALMNLDDEGIVRVGVEVQPGDILVGKVTPKGERQMSPEEKLLQAVFGEKANDYKDSSLRMPTGAAGVVIDVKVFTSEEIRKKDKKRDSAVSKRALAINEEELQRYKKKQQTEMQFIKEDAAARIRQLVGDAKKAADLDKLKTDEFFKLRVKDTAINDKIEEIVAAVSEEEKAQQKRLKATSKKLTEGHDLAQGILKTVKVYVAIKRPLQVGDKMAGRHGNKGVVSRIEPVESMPYLADGTPVDIVLNPLGVPSRMNVGQILETHLGFAAKGLGNKLSDMLYLERKKQLAEIRAMLTKIYGGDNTANLKEFSEEELIALARNLTNGVPFATPIFDGASETEIGDMLELADLPKSGQVTLYDGHSGEAFNRPVTVGYMYIMKLHHLVDDKMHSRSTGPYSLVTQQPLGGKALGGGQRFGEMEVWALEAYGAAYTLCEMLTVKSDDISWRSKMFENIIDNDFQLRSGVPESFNVLVQEIRSMGIDMDFE